MIVSVVVSTDGTLQETIARVGRAIRDGKKLFRGRLVDIAVRGPRKGISDGVLTKLQYRLTNREVSDLKHLWDVSPNELIHAGAEYGKAHR